MNKAQLNSLIIVPMVTGSTSFIASSTLIVSILRSTQKLSKIYRRFIFGLSAFDILQSLSQALSTTMMPKWTKIWLAVGNDTSCDISAFLAVLGSCGSIVYSLSLTIYFLLVIKFDLKDRNISEKYEPFLHAFPIIYASTVSITIYATGNYNPAGPVCWIASEPLNCRDDPNIDCMSWGDPDVFKWISAGGPALVVLFVNAIIFVVIWRTVLIQTKKSESYSHSWIRRPEEDHDDAAPEQQPNKMFPCSNCLPRKKKPKQPTSPLAERLSKRSKASVRRLKEISNRAIAYIVGYFLTYLFTFVYRVIELSGSKVPFAIIFLSRFFYPLQGLFNVLIYTYPHVMSHMKNNENTSWLKAFWEVVKSGGDSDQQGTGSAKFARRRESLRKKSLVLAQAEKRNTLKTVTPEKSPFAFLENEIGSDEENSLVPQKLAFAVPSDDDDDDDDNSSFQSSKNNGELFLGTAKNKSKVNTSYSKEIAVGEDEDGQEKTDESISKFFERSSNEKLSIEVEANDS